MGNPQFCPPVAYGQITPDWKETQLAKAEVYLGKLKRLAAATGDVVRDGLQVEASQAIDFANALSDVLTSPTEEYIQTLKTTPATIHLPAGYIDPDYLVEMIEERDQLAESLTQVDKIGESYGDSPAAEAIRELMRLYEPMIVAPMRRRLQQLDQQIRKAQAQMERSARASVEHVEGEDPLYPKKHSAIDYRGNLNDLFVLRCVTCKELLATVAGTTGEELMKPGTGNRSDGNQAVQEFHEKHQGHEIEAVNYEKRFEGFPPVVEACPHCGNSNPAHQVSTCPEREQSKGDVVGKL